MSILGISGTFHPFTNGHLWLVKEALKLGKKVHIFVSTNPTKPVTDGESRLRVVEQIIRDEGLQQRVSCSLSNNRYIADLAQHKNITHMVRGLRNANDFSYEKQINEANVDLLNGPPTVWVMATKESGVSDLSSSYVRAFQPFVGWHWKVKSMLPRAAYDHYVEQWLLDRWTKAFVNSNMENMFQDMLVVYRQPHRFYHTLDHIVHGLSEIEELQISEHERNILRRAWFVHDWFYDGEKDDEIRSAGLLTQHGCSLYGEHLLVLATQHFAADTVDHPLKSHFLCVDLAILGQPSSIYDAYTTQVRREYQKYDDDSYATGRKSVVKSLLEKAKRGALFPLNTVHAYYNDQAIVNLENELAQLDI